MGKLIGIGCNFWFNKYVCVLVIGCLMGVYWLLGLYLCMVVIIVIFVGL